MKLKSLAVIISLISMPVFAGWAPVQTVATNPSLDVGSTGFVGLNTLQWGRSGNVSVAGITLPQLIQLNRSSLQNGAWTTQAISAKAWLAAPARVGKTAAFWVQRPNPYDLTAATDSVHAAFLNNASWTEVELAGFENDQILPSEILSAAKLPNGNFQINVATADATQISRSTVRGLLSNAQGLLLQSGDSSVGKLDYAGLKVFRNNSVIYSVLEGKVYSHSLNASGTAWDEKLAYESTDAGLQIIDVQNNVALLAKNYNQTLVACHIKADASLVCGAELVLTSGWKLQSGEVKAVSGTAAVISWSEVNSADGSLLKVKTAHVSANNVIVAGPEFVSGQAFNVVADGADHFALSWINSTKTLRLAEWNKVWQTSVKLAAEVLAAKSCFVGSTPAVAWVNSAGKLMYQPIKSGAQVTEVAAGWSTVLDCVGSTAGAVQVAGVSSQKALVVAAYTADAAVETPTDPDDDPSRGGTDSGSGSDGGGGGTLGFSGLSLLALAALRKNARVSNP